MSESTKEDDCPLCKNNGPITVLRCECAACDLPVKFWEPIKAMAAELTALRASHAELLGACQRAKQYIEAGTGEHDDCRCCDCVIKEKLGTAISNAQPAERGEKGE